MTELPSDFVAYLEDEGKSAESAIHQYLENPNRFQDIHLFVEGDDDGPFYGFHAKYNTGKEYHFYICGGKSNVVQAYTLLSKGKISENVYFFVDRDHEDFIIDSVIAPHPIYTTDFYSFESFFIGKCFIDFVIRDRMHILPSSALAHSICASFDASELSFARAMRPHMALILALRESGTRLNLNNLSLDRVVSLGENGIFKRKPRSLSSTIRQFVIDEIKISISDILRWARRITLCARLNWLRGKYYTWALYGYLNLVAENLASSRKKIGKKKGSIHPTLQSYGNFCATLHLKDTPPSLKAVFS